MKWWVVFQGAAKIWRYCGERGRGEKRKEGSWERGGEGREQRRGKSFTILREDCMYVTYTAVLHTLMYCTHCCCTDNTPRSTHCPHQPVFLLGFSATGGGGGFDPCDDTGRGSTDDDIGPPSLHGGGGAGLPRGLSRVRVLPSSVIVLAVGSDERPLDCK